MLHYIQSTNLNKVSSQVKLEKIANLKKYIYQINRLNLSFISRKQIKLRCEIT